MPNVAQSPVTLLFVLLPPRLPPAFTLWSGRQKTAPNDHSKLLIFLRKPGAGEGIRTLDPNLGKVAVVPLAPRRAARGLLRR